MRLDGFDAAVGLRRGSDRPAEPVAAPAPAAPWACCSRAEAIRSLVACIESGEGPRARWLPARDYERWRVDQARQSGHAGALDRHPSSVSIRRAFGSWANALTAIGAGNNGGV